MSLDCPLENGTIIRIGLLGYCVSLWLGKACKVQTPAAMYSSLRMRLLVSMLIFSPAALTALVEREVVE